MVTAHSVERVLRHIPTMPAENQNLIIRAYEFAKEAHGDQVRYSGEPYLTHLVAVSAKLAEIGMGVRTIAAALLHDTLEDTDVSVETFKAEFGEEIFFLVEGVTKLGSVRYTGSNRYNESLRKLFVATSQDVRVLIIKLYDRLHNMQTLQFVPTDKQYRIACETLEIYAPIAHRLGMGKLSRELEDLSFPYVYPEEYERVCTCKTRKADSDVCAIDQDCAALTIHLQEKGIGDVQTSYRIKGMYSLYKKLVGRDWNIDEIYDYYAIHVVVDTVAECYQVLGIINNYWRLIPKCMKDYIAFPKPNGYQSLHTTVLAPTGNIIEVQIRTKAMHKEAEAGIVYHFTMKNEPGYDTGATSKSWLGTLIPYLFQPFERYLSKSKVAADAGATAPAYAYDKKNIPLWIQEIADAYKHVENNAEFLDGMKQDFFSQRIFAFTPQGDVIDLPVGASPIDFAYAVHSDIGDQTADVKINHKTAALDVELHNGDIVEIITESHQKPRKKWLEFVKTSTARHHIRAALGKAKHT